MVSHGRLLHQVQPTSQLADLVLPGTVSYGLQLVQVQTPSVTQSTVSTGHLFQIHRLQASRHRDSVLPGTVFALLPLAQVPIQSSTQQTALTGSPYRVAQLSSPAVARVLPGMVFAGLQWVSERIASHPRLTVLPGQLFQQHQASSRTQVSALVTLPMYSLLILNKPSIFYHRIIQSPYAQRTRFSIPSPQC